MGTTLMQNIDGYYYHRTENKTCSNSTQHYHSGYEIYYMKEGKCHYFINDTSYDIVSGDIVLIPEGTVHGTSYGTKPCTRLLINFNHGFISPDILKGASNIGHLYRNKSTASNINDIFSMIEAEYQNGDFLSAHALKSLTESLLILMIRNQSEIVRQERNTIVERAVKYIQENYMTTIRLSDVAKILSVSEEHLSRTFKKEITFGFNEYVTLIRLQKAEHMLKNEPSRAITEVAYACGFNDSNYFSYKFKKTFGLTPSQVRDGSTRFEELPHHLTIV